MIKSVCEKRGRGTRLVAGALVVLAALGGIGCSLEGLLHSDELPKDVNDPALTQTPQGAQAAYNATLADFRNVFSSVVRVTGQLSDELQGSWLNSGDPVDQRNMPDNPSETVGGASLYAQWQQRRGQAGQAIGLLSDYLPDQPALAGHLYALQGYVELFLAEFFCSGIPLSTLDYHGDYTYRPGSTTAQVLTHAAALFDTALALAGDSVRVLRLAQVGKGRAMLGLGDYAAAAAAVEEVPDDYRYNVTYNTVIGTGAASNFAKIDSSTGLWSYTVPDREGTNGMPWRTSGDPRTPIVQRGQETTNTHRPLYYPSRFDPLGGTPIVLASGIEARLIEAEAALQGGNNAWLPTLNALRTDSTFDTTAVTPPDTLWHAGTGGVARLAPLVDPGTDTARVSLLFRERAFWLFLTGHRQGDLRRLIRQYGRFPNTIYPVGAYPYSPIAAPYGADVTAPIPISEYLNPLFTGCASRGA